MYIDSVIQFNNSCAFCTLLISGKAKKEMKSNKIAENMYFLWFSTIVKACNNWWNLGKNNLY